jgi:hypothetical protein
MRYLWPKGQKKKAILNPLSVSSFILSFLHIITSSKPNVNNTRAPVDSVDAML